MNVLFTKAQKECMKREKKLEKIKKWNTYNTLKVFIKILNVVKLRFRIIR